MLTLPSKVGMFVSLCLASQKPSEREFSVPAGMDLGVKLLSVPSFYTHFCNTLN